MTTKPLRLLGEELEFLGETALEQEIASIDMQKTAIFEERAPVLEKYQELMRRLTLRSNKEDAHQQQVLSKRLRRYKKRLSELANKETPYKHALNRLRNRTNQTRIQQMESESEIFRYFVQIARARLPQETFDRILRDAAVAAQKRGG